MKKLIVFGSTGMLGNAVNIFFKSKGYQVYSLGRSEFDILTDPLEKAFQYLNQADLVVNCAGVIKPRLKDFSVEEIFAVNAVFVKNIANYCKQNNIPCFHITTDGVFSGTKGNYSENDFFDSLDLYSHSKLAGETTDCMVLRTSIVGEEQGQSRSLLEWARSNKGKEVNGFLNHHWNGVTTLYLAEIIESIYSEGAYQKGIFHIHSAKPVNKYELLSLISEIYALGLKVNPVDASEFCDRTLKSIYPISAKYSVKSIPQQLQEMKMFFSGT